MNTVKFKKGNVKMIAHRGVSGLECENTAAAFVAAGNRSYAGIETDTHITADGRFVIIHDADTERVSGGIKANVEALSLTAVSGITLLDKIDRLPRRDLLLPTAEEYIRICRKYEKTAVLELKGPSNAERYAELVKMIGDLGHLGQTIFISFGKQNVLDMRALLPEAKIQFLTSTWSDDILDFLLANRLDLDIGHAAVTPELVSLIHSHGLEINCWTVDDPSRAEELAAMGVDYITSNILE